MLMKVHGLPVLNFISIRTHLIYCTRVNQNCRWIKNYSIPKVALKNMQFSLAGIFLISISSKLSIKHGNKSQSKWCFHKLLLSQNLSWLPFSAGAEIHRVPQNFPSEKSTVYWAWKRRVLSKFALRPVLIIWNIGKIRSAICKNTVTLTELFPCCVLGN